MTGSIDLGTKGGLFWRFWTASTVSALGDAVSAVALPLLAVTTLGATSLQVGLVAAAGYAAWAILGLPAGVIVGRLPLRETQVAMDLVRAIALGTIPVAYWAGWLSLAQVVVVAFVVSLASVVFFVGNSTFLPSIVSADQLTHRNSQFSASYSATQLGGPALGGVLVQLFGAASSVLFDVVSYLVSAALLQGLPRPPIASPSGHDSMRVLIREGWRFVMHHPVIRPAVMDATVVNFVLGGLMALTPVFLVRTLGASPALVGVLLAAGGLGSLIGAMFTPRIARRLGTARVLMLSTFSFAGFLALIPMSTGALAPIVFAVGYAGLAAGDVMGSIVTRAHRQIVTPAGLLPRAMATVRFISWGVIPVGAVVAGALANVVGVRGALVVFSVVAFASPAIIWRSPVRHLHDLADAG